MTVVEMGASRVDEALGEAPPLGEPDLAEREQLVLALYRSHYGRMQRLAFLLLGGSGDAEDVAQEAFIRVYDARHQLRDPERAEAYLRSVVVNLARSQLRRRVVALRHAPRPAPEPEGPEERALAALRDGQVVRALATLPRRQREVLVLRYFLDLSEAQTARELRTSLAAVKSAAARGTAALAVLLEERR